MNSTTFNIPAPRLIDNQTDFLQTLPRFTKVDTLAVDTEANSLYAYQEQVCLIQISTREQDYILDPLNLEDISPLGKVFSNPEIEKIFHASEYDILILYDDFGFEFQNLFDTMIAAQILGKKKLGLDSLLQQYYGVKVNKKYQRADWGKRPLSEEMLHYAQMDTHYLIGIRERLGEELSRSTLQPIAEEDFQLACKAHLIEREEKLPPCWRMKEARELPPQQAAVLQKLSEFRDRTARKQDKPLFKVLNKKTLLTLAQESPRSISELKKLKIGRNRAVERYAKGILQAIQEGLQADPISPPRSSRPDNGYLAREKALKEWRKYTARRLNVNSAVVLPKTLLLELASEKPTTPEQLSRILKDVPWRLKEFGSDILHVLSQVDY